MAMQHVPREQAGAESPAQTHKDGHGDRHGIATRQQQPRERTHNQAFNEKDDEKEDEAQRLNATPDQLLFVGPVTRLILTGYPRASSAAFLGQRVNFSRSEKPLRAQTVSDMSRAHAAEVVDRVGAVALGFRRLS